MPASGERSTARRIARMVRRTLVAEGTMEVAFDMGPEPFRFMAGQYVSVFLAGLEQAAVQDRFHDFSIASSPEDEHAISIATRVSESPFKSALLSRPLGETVQIEGPKGRFVLPEDPARPVLFFAGGIGVTPFLSMIRFAAQTHAGRRITLVVSNGTRQRAAYLDELGRIAASHAPLAVVPLFGPLTAEAVAHALESATERALCYVAGPPGFVETARAALRSRGVAPERIEEEQFSGYA